MIKLSLDATQNREIYIYSLFKYLLSLFHIYLFPATIYF